MTENTNNEAESAKERELRELLERMKDDPKAGKAARKALSVLNRDPRTRASFSMPASKTEELQDLAHAMGLSFSRAVELAVDALLAKERRRLGGSIPKRPRS